MNDLSKLLRSALLRRCLPALAGALVCLHAMSQTAPTPDTEDPFLWLEDVQGERALAWVRERNAHSQQVLQATPGFESLRSRLAELLNSTDRIPRIARHGDWLYNFWQDPTNKRGLWRRTTLAEYRKPGTRWETVLDLDALAAAEGENWVWGGANCLGPQDRRCLISLSRGGADAKVVREFDTVTKAFVKDGFTLPEAKSDVEWLDADTVYVGTDFGPGSLTSSGYPRISKRWKRGTPLSAAVTVFEGKVEDVWAGVAVDRTPGFERTIFVRAPDFYTQERFLLQGDRLVRLDLPADAQVRFMHSAGTPGDTLLIELRSELKTTERTYPSGALLATDARTLLQGGERRYQVLFEPTATRSLAGFTTTRSHVIVNVLDNVASKLEEWRSTPKGFVRREIKAPFPGTLVGGQPQRPDARARSAVRELHPALHRLPHPGFAVSGQHRHRSAQRAQGAVARLRCHGHAGRSVLRRAVPTARACPTSWSGRPARKADGSNPTLLYGYGGFRNALEPWYSRGFGNAWYKRGGVLVVANIRGGGEFGPAWHQAAVKANKQRSYDDFIAVAEDLIARKITSPRHLGIEGGSNGGLLVGAVFTQRPELFNAVVCQVPLLDMKRYHKLLAGASWMAEYGNPDMPGGVGLDLALQPVPQRQARGEVPARALHHLDARRPGAPGPCAQDGGAHAVAGPRPAVLREHRGWPRARSRQPAARPCAGAGVQLPLAAAVTLIVTRGPVPPEPSDTPNHKKRHPGALPMKPIRFKNARRQWLAAATALLALPALGAFPDKPIKLLIGFPAGGPLDAHARLLAERLQQVLGQPVVIDYKAGAGGTVAEFVAKSPADGYTLLMANTGTMVINPAVYTKLPYQTLKDFTPIARTAQQPLALVVNPSVPARTVQELVALAKSTPGRLNYGSAATAASATSCPKCSRAPRARSSCTSLTAAARRHSPTCWRVRCRSWRSPSRRPHSTSSKASCGPLR